MLREMPPWHLDKTVGITRYKDDRSLTDEQIDTIVRWVDGGAPLGNPADLPPPVQFNDDEWTIGVPDLIVTSPEAVMYPEGSDWWPSYVVDLGLTETRFARAVETRPSQEGRQFVHHAITSLIDPEARDTPARLGQGEPVLDPLEGAYLSEYAPGKYGDVFPEHTGRALKAGAKLRFSMHYFATGREMRDRTSVGFVLYPQDVEPTWYITDLFIHENDTIDIPPGEMTRTDTYYSLPAAARIISLPAAHAPARQGAVHGGHLPRRAGRDAELRRPLRLQLARRLSLRGRRDAPAAGGDDAAPHLHSRQHRHQPPQSGPDHVGRGGGSAASTTWRPRISACSTLRMRTSSGWWLNTARSRRGGWPWAVNRQRVAGGRMMRPMTQWMLRVPACVCGGMLLLAGSTAGGQPPQARQSGIYEQMRRLLNVRHKSGQNVHPVFEGWERNPDGTASLYWGYMNRNWAEALDIPIGPANHFAPGPPDRGQPTHFLPRRVKQLFKIVVPGDFDGEYVWTLSIRGRPESVPGSLKPPQMIDVQTSSSNENTPPKLALGPDLTVAFPDSAILSVGVTDDGLPRPRGGTGPGLSVRWSKYRGPGEVTFGPAEPPVEDGRAVATAAVREPGEYTLAVLADDGSYYGTAQGQGVPGFACCWTFGFIKVTYE